MSTIIQIHCDATQEQTIRACQAAFAGTQVFELAKHESGPWMLSIRPGAERTVLQSSDAAWSFSLEFEA